MVGKRVGEMLSDCDWVGIPMSGGMSELVYITANSILVNDLHRHVINLAMVIADPVKKNRLVESLEFCPVHPDTLAEAQNECAKWEGEGRDPDPDGCYPLRS